ncbi:DUF6316 family protein [Pleionea sediminis]|uniref:DUF6316 family protein n=1 Tax=Pleionea sediminis TaxID=2569479 RepID=UPI003CCC5CE3
MSRTRLVKRDRIFKHGKSWFFATREGIDMGPFPDQTSAELEMVNYVKSMNPHFQHKGVR